MAASLKGGGKVGFFGLCGDYRRYRAQSNRLPTCGKKYNSTGTAITDEQLHN
jgi:hypothetical protein